MSMFNVNQPLTHLLPPAHATPSFLKTHLSSSLLFSSLSPPLTESQLDDLIEAGQHTVFPSGSVLVKQGAVLSTPAVHIIEDGEVGVTVKRDDRDVKVASVAEGLVGDACILTDQPSTVTYLANTTVHTYSIPLSAFTAVLSSSPPHNEQINHRRWLWSSLSKMPQFSQLDDVIKKEQLIEAFKEEKRRKGDTIVRYGDQGDRFYVIKDGVCEVRVPYSQSTAPVPGRRDSDSMHSVAVGGLSPSAGAPHPSSFTHTTPQTLSPFTPSSTTSLPLSVDDSTFDSNLSSLAPPDVPVALKQAGESFGELALLYSVPRAATVSCISDSCTLYSIDGTTFNSACTEASLYLKDVFLEFATLMDKRSGERLMSENDFCNAMKKMKKYKKKSRKKEKEESKDDPASISTSAEEDITSNLTESQLHLMFRLADQSGDNYISLSEFVLLNSLLRGAKSQYQFAFRVFDKDKSGNIDKEEFIQVIRSLAGDKSTTINLKNDPFIVDIFGPDVDAITGLPPPFKKTLSYSQFESLLQRDMLPSFLSSVKHDLRMVDEQLMRWNAGMNESATGLVMAESKSTHAAANWKALVAGGIAGAVSRTVVSPLERIKLLFQMQGNPPKYSTMLQAIRLIYKEDGLYGYFRGNFSNVIRITPTSACQFYFYEVYKGFFFGRSKKELTPFQRLIAGGCAGMTACAITYPLDLVRARLTLQTGKTQKYKGIIHGFSCIVREEGVKDNSEHKQSEEYLPYFTFSSQS